MEVRCLLVPINLSYFTFIQKGGIKKGKNGQEIGHFGNGSTSYSAKNGLLNSLNRSNFAPQG